MTAMGKPINPRPLPHAVELRIDDPKNARQAVVLKADMIEQGFIAGLARAHPTHDPAGLLFAGMGGSGATAALIRDACTRAMDIPFTIVQHYQIPNHVRRGWHVLALSYSGATEETLSVVRGAKDRRLPVTGFASGGRLEELSDEFVTQPPGFMPRFALGHAWFSVLGYLEGSGILREETPVQAAAAAVREVDKECGFDASEDNPARRLAKVLEHSVPQIYATPAFLGCATWLRAMLNENAKRIAGVEQIPECNHNDLMGWGGDGLRRHFTAICISHGEQNPEIRKRIAFMAQKYEEWGVPWHHHLLAPVHTYGEHVVEQARFIQFADYVSLYLAELHGVDPGEIRAIEALKATLRS